MAMSAITPIWAKELVQSYQQDPVAKQLLAQLLLHHSHTTSDHQLTPGIIRSKGIILVGNVPALRTRLLVALHSSPIGGHSGKRATYQTVKNIFYWPGLKKEVEIFLVACYIC